ncbi:hypothetical protein B0J11DRAFT_586936 [Dendryphion nanum]|uniref:Uncharacterized protein n=1 Tax=Dendryphion nanum TaxID=256645 RepID=A0A9P9EJK2_9PLEO|nr:hypothetical protein B0J11DRAFT_586936 [Dendryphion nanum]
MSQRVNNQPFCDGPAGTIFQTWYHLHDVRPTIDFGRYFANPFRILDCKVGNIPQLIDAHHKLDDDFNPRNYQLHWLCRALIVVFDHVDGSSLQLCCISNAAHTPRVPITSDYEQPNTVVIVRTGDDHFLDASIAFETLANKLLSLNGPDMRDGGNIKAVRIPLVKSIEFIVDLQKR